MALPFIKERKDYAPYSEDYLDAGDLYDIDTEYDHNYDCILGLKLRGTKAIDGATLRMLDRNHFEVVFNDKILGKLEIDI